jgi:hypothetical protein
LVSPRKRWLHWLPPRRRWLRPRGQRWLPPRGRHRESAGFRHAGIPWR